MAQAITRIREERTIETKPIVIGVAPAKLIRALLAVSLFLVVAGVAAQWFALATGHNNMLGLIPEFSLDDENNVPTWFSSLALFLCATVLLVLGKLEPAGTNWRARYWFALAAIFALLSLDESASLHEKVDSWLRHLGHFGGFLSAVWVVPGALAVGVAAIALRRFLLSLPPETRRRMVTSGAVYVAGCIGMEMLGVKVLSIYGRTHLFYQLMVACEEGLEMLGTILFLRALLAYMMDHTGGFTIRLRN